MRDCQVCKGAKVNARLPVLGLAFVLAGCKMFVGENKPQLTSCPTAFYSDCNASPANAVTIATRAGGLTRVPVTSSQTPLSPSVHGTSGTLSAGSRPPNISATGAPPIQTPTSGFSPPALNLFGGASEVGRYPARAEEISISLTAPQGSAENGPSINSDLSKLPIPIAIGPFHNTSIQSMGTQLNSEFISGTGYRQWKNNSLKNLPSLKAFGTSYVDPTLCNSMKSGKEDHPVGSTSVLELFGDAAGTHLKAWAILAKGTDSKDANAWLSTEISMKDGVYVAATYAMGAASCAACHTGLPGYMVPIAL